MEDLIKLRDEIDDIDDQVVRLFERRMAVAEKVAAYKRSVGKPVLDKERKKSKFKRLRKRRQMNLTVMVWNLCSVRLWQSAGCFSTSVWPVNR